MNVHLCVWPIPDLHPPAGPRVCVCFVANDQTVITLLSPNVAVKIKKPIKTKFRMPVFNWVALKPNQINGTVFNEIDDERILEVSVSLGNSASRRQCHGLLFITRRLLFSQGPKCGRV